LEEDLARSRGELYTIIEERDSLISALSESRERIAYLRHGIKKEEHDVGRIDLVLKYQGVQTKNLIPRPHSSIRAAQERSSGAELE
jgi:hypothetical protein